MLDRNLAGVVAIVAGLADRGAGAAPAMSVIGVLGSTPEYQAVLRECR
jgi:hypothetical protein